jgi:hypothetical protein
MAVFIFPSKETSQEDWHLSSPPAVTYAEKLPLGITMGSKKFCQRDLR